MEWPRGYSYVPGGELETRNESFGGLQTAMIIALLGIIAVLVLEFGSFKSTLIVLSVVPFGIAGGIIALALTGNTISFTATIGFIALIGIETKNSILLVDFTNQLRAEGVPLDEAIERAGEIRFLPILLTSATAIGGLLPLAVQNAGMYSPLAWVIIGGLVSSTLVARVVTPVMYKLIPPAIEVSAFARGRRSPVAVGARSQLILLDSSNPHSPSVVTAEGFFFRRLTCSMSMSGSRSGSRSCFSRAIRSNGH